MHNLALVTLILLIGSAVCTEVKKCSGGSPLPVSVNISGCEGEICEFARGSTERMDVKFVGIKEETDGIRSDAVVTMIGIAIPVMIGDHFRNVCANLLDDAQCPVGLTDEVVYRMPLKIDNNLPEVSADLKIKLVDQDGDVVACFVKRVNIVSGN